MKTINQLLEEICENLQRQILEHRVVIESLAEKTEDEVLYTKTAWSKTHMRIIQKNYTKKEVVKDREKEIGNLEVQLKAGKKLLAEWQKGDGDV